jgi:hypothetical protein
MPGRLRFLPAKPLSLFHSEDGLRISWRKRGLECMGLAAGICLLMIPAGCGLQLETGYQYRPLNASSTERRAYYAPAFTAEKSAVDEEKKGAH